MASDLERQAGELLDAHCPIDYKRALTGANAALFKQAALDAIVAALQRAAGAEHGGEEGWVRFDEKRPPAPGLYLVWDPGLRDPTEPVLWEFREVGRMERWRAPEPGEMAWHRAGWQVERAPAYYRKVSLPAAALRNKGVKHG